MDETQWQLSKDPLRMLAVLNGRGGARKYRLFAAACCRLIWDRFPDDRNRALVATVERHPDGDFHDPELNSAITASSAEESRWRDLPAYWAAKWLGRSYYKTTPENGASVAIIKALSSVEDKPAMEAGMADFARDVFGPLAFRSVTIEAHWLTPVVRGLAESIYNDRCFDRLPILADALEEAGCDRRDLLSHLRGDDPHVLGCWGLDLALGRT
jgi:hypothetical protein